MEQLTKIFEFDGTPVTFKNENGVVYVNATELGKSSGKRPYEYLRLSSTIQYMQALETTTGKSRTDFFMSTVGGTAPGTWLNEDLALHFAQWISPAFYVKCNQHIKELLKHGFTATPSTIEDMVNNPDLIISMATKLKEERAEKEKYQTMAGLQAKQLQISAPKVQYHDKVLQSSSLMPINLIAKELGMSAVTLNKKLHQLGIQYQSGGAWVLYAKYQGQGWTGVRTHTYFDSEGRERTVQHTYWTEKGRQYIHTVLNQQLQSTPSK